MRLPFLIVLLLLGSAADTPTREQARLARDLAGRTRGPTQDCVSIDPTTSLRPVDQQTLVLDRGATLYVNHLRGSCPGLEPTDTLILEAHGNQYCRGDRFRSRPFGGGVVPGPVCILGDFVPYRRAAR